MFNFDQLSIIFDYLNGKDVDLETQIKNTADSELARTERLFEETLDQVAFSSSDYRRLRTFIIRFYATHKTLTAIQENVTDLFFLPTEHIHELMRSFGFPHGPKISDFINKVNFFLELVNLYKIKGTKQSITNILNYFNIPNSYLIEYFLTKNQDGDLVFRQQLSQTVPPDIRDRISLKDINFDSIVNLDPRWFQTKDDIEKLIDQNKINLPSRAPYFSLRTSYEYNTVEPIPLYFFNLITEYYNKWKDTGELPPKTVTSKVLKQNLSILEFYAALIYSFNLYFGIDHENSDRVRMYTGELDYDGYEDEFSSQFEIPPVSRDELEKLRSSWREDLTGSTSNYPFSNKGDAKDLLESINPEAKSLIDSWGSEVLSENITIMTTEFSYWMRLNIDTEFKEIGVYIFGWKAFKTIDINDLINFFKPYRARFILSDLEYILNRPLFESIRYEDIFNTNLDQTIVDFGTADGSPCEDDTGPRTTYDCGSTYDTGIVKADYIVISDVNEIGSDHLHDTELNTAENITSKSSYGLSGYQLNGGTVVCNQDAGYLGFDEGATFDNEPNYFGNEIVSIISEVITTGDYEGFVTSDGEIYTLSDGEYYVQK